MSKSKFFVFLLLISFATIFSYRIYQNREQNPETIVNADLLGFKNFPPSPVSFITTRLNSNKSLTKLYSPFSDNVSSGIYFSVTNLGKTKTSPLIIVNDKDWTSNEAIIRTIFQGNIPSSTEEKAIKIVSYISQYILHAQPVFPTWSEIDLAVPLLNQVGYEYCSGFSVIIVNLFQTLNIPSRIVFLDGHVVSEIMYDQSWHMFDADGGCYFRKQDGKIASAQEIMENSSLVKDNTNCLTDVYTNANTKKNANYVYPEQLGLLPIPHLPKAMKFTLFPKDEIRYYYNWKNSYYWNYLNREPYLYTNGLLISKIESIPFERTISLPYPIVSSEISAKGICRWADQIKISLDSGKTWKNGRNYCQNDVLNFEKAIPKGRNSTITFSYLLRIEHNLPLKEITLLTMFQLAPNSIPKLHKGENKMELKNTNEENILVKFAFL